MIFLFQSVVQNGTCGIIVTRRAQWQRYSGSSIRLDHFDIVIIGVEQLDRMLWTNFSTFNRFAGNCKNFSACDESRAIYRLDPIEYSILELRTRSYY